MTYYGKYRGKVESNLDPLQLGRLQVRCPSVLGDGTLSWAMPSVPYAGRGVGFFVLPPRQANVWVEFEAGDPDYPIWSGCFWGPGEAPTLPAVADMKVLKTDGIAVTLNTLAGVGGVTVEVSPPLVPQAVKFALTAQGIVLECTPAKLTVTPTSIDVQLTPAGLKVSASGVELTAAAATAKVAPASVELGMGASSVKLSPVSVSVNNGALEVI